jgi:hypothetical protein
MLFLVFWYGDEGGRAMLAREGTSGGAETQGDDKFRLSAPQVSLPKGGAVRGMGETFAANPVTGTGSMTRPVATSPGRSGFSPRLSRSYESGSGNGPFSFGRSLSFPDIARKTGKGLPQYRDAEESGVYVLSGTENLVPVYRQDLDGTWVASHPWCQRDPEGFWVRDQKGHLANRSPLLDNAGHRPRFLDEPKIDTQIGNADRMFEMVFDYDDLGAVVPKPNDDQISLETAPRPVFHRSSARYEKRRRKSFRIG